MAAPDSLITPTYVGGAGGGQYYGVGGGYIRINSSQGCLLDGNITADGANANPPGENTGACGGGAGGSIFIELNNGSLIGSGSVSAQGGRGANGGGGGGGGRIAIANLDVSGVKVSCRGGQTANSMNFTAQTCESGGSGTYFDNKHQSPDKCALNCIGSLTDSSALAVTPLPTNFTAPAFVLTYCNLLISNLTLNFSASMVMSSYSKLISTTAEKGIIRINGGNLKVTTYSKIAGDELDFRVNSLVVDQFSNIFFNNACRVVANDSIDLSSRLTDTAAGATYLYLTSNRTNLSSNAYASLHARYIFMESNLIQISGGIVASYTGLSDCSANYTLPNCSSMPDNTSTVGLWVKAKTLQQFSSSRIQAAIVVFCAENMTLGGNLMANGAGCSPGRGIGVGQSLSGVPGGGAGHGGIGGSATEGSQISHGGPTYDDPNNPVCVGSGGASETYGGAGGGLVALLANDTIIIEGSVTVAGANGRGPPLDSYAVGGGGGGSGGTLRIETANLYGNGVGYLDLSGGQGGDPGGGGGAGGILHLVWLQNAINPRNLQLPLVIIKSQGGYGGTYLNPIVQGENGSYGAVTTVPTCSPGQGGLYCLTCGPGFYQPISSNSLCLTCPAGTMAGGTGATFCSNCSAGTFSSGGSSSCATCQAGTSSKSGAASCSLCQPGFYSLNRAAECLSCPKGYYAPAMNGSVCFQCQAGFFTESPGSSHCEACDNIPAHATYLPGDCTYQCDAGYVEPDCITPFQNTINSLGGELAFYLILAGVVVLLSSPFIWCWLTNRKERKAREIAEVEEVTRLNMERHAAASKYRGFSHLSQNMTRYHRLDAAFRSPEKTKPRLEDGSITTDELRYHLHRVYFGGYNDFDNPLALPVNADADISSMVLTQEYQYFAEKLSATTKWAFWEKLCYRFLCLLYFPLASVFIYFRRKHYINKLWEAYSSFDHSFFRDYQARALGDSLKFGSSADSTLAWVDVLVRQPREDIAPHRVGKPTLPIILVCAGDGSFFAPFHLDVTDPMVKCLSVYFGRNWHKFVCALNNLLRPISRRELFDPVAWRKAVEMVSKMDRVGIGIGKLMPRGEVSIELGIVGSNFSHEGEPPPIRRGRRTIFATGGDTPFDSFSDPARRWSENNPRSRTSSDLLLPKDSMHTRTSRVNSDAGGLLTREAQLSQSSQGRMAASDTVIVNSLEPSGSEAIAEKWDELDVDTFIFNDPEWRRQRFGATPRPVLILQAKENVNRNLPLPFGAIPLRLILDLTPPECGRHLTSRMKSFCQRWLASLFLVNVRKKGRSLWTGAVLMILLLAHLTFYLVVGINYAQVIPTQLIYVMCIFPFVPALVPIFGFTAMVSSSIECCRFFAALNLLGLCNGLVAIVCGVTGDGQSRLGTYDGTVFPAAVTFVDLMLIFIANRYVAHLEYSRESSLSRRDYLYDKFSEDGYGSTNNEDASVFELSINPEREDCEGENRNHAHGHKSAHVHKPQETGVTVSTDTNDSDDETLVHESSASSSSTPPTSTSNAHSSSTSPATSSMPSGTIETKRTTPKLFTPKISTNLRTVVDSPADGEDHLLVQDSPEPEELLLDHPLSDHEGPSNEMHPPESEGELSPSTSLNYLASPKSTPKKSRFFGSDEDDRSSRRGNKYRHHRRKKQKHRR